MLQLTFIPPKYWKNSSSGFKLISIGKEPPNNVGFFIFWISPNENKNWKMDLTQEIKRVFPSIPAEKLLTCKIRLALGDILHQETKSDSLLKTSLIEGKIIPIPPAIRVLFPLQIVNLQDRSHKFISYSNSIKTWAFLTKFTLELLSRGNFIPTLKKIDSKHYEGMWNVIFKTQLDHQRFQKILNNAPWISYNLPINFISSKKDEFKTTGIWHPSFLFAEYMNLVADFLIRDSLKSKFYKKFSNLYDSDLDELENACNLDENNPWDLRFLNSCIGKNRIFEITRFCDTPIPGILQNWVQQTQGFSFALGVLFTFRLEYPKSPKSDWKLGVYIQPLHDLNCFIALSEVWNGNVTQKEEFANVCDDEEGLQEEILRALGIAVKLFPPLKRILEVKNPNRIKLDISEVMDFLRYSQHLLRQVGFNVVLPEQFRHKGQQRLSARMVIKDSKSVQKRRQSGSATGNISKLFDLNSFLEFEWEARLENQKLTESEFLELSKLKEPLIFWRDQWILVDQEDMNALRPIFEQKQKIKGKLSLSEAINLGITKNIQLSDAENSYEVVLEGNFHNYIDQFSNIDSFQKTPTPALFKGVLRPYQEIGLLWLANMTDFNFGICLADDMGLGKTIEVISFLLHREEKYNDVSSGSILIICPTSVLFNWHRELQKFAPSLDILVYHGKERIDKSEALTEFTIPNRIILTTYGIVRNEIEVLEAISFTGVILDESQNIKNFKAQQTKAILRLKSMYRIAMTGTPIENRLIELWTLFEFLNPGLLGSRANFYKNFILPIERFHNEEGSNKLKRIISPFILRRLKTDKNIIQDLPEKNEIKIFLELSKDQSELYTKTVNSTLKEIENLEIQESKRRGLVLRLLTQTKQICNHPYQFLHIDSLKIESSPDYNFDDFIKSSVKLERLLEMVNEILEDGEKLLIFTQFKQMGDLLKYFLEKKYSFNVGWFHGGVPEKKRRELVDEFQSQDLDSSPILILSLRAGGTGLNLTQASTVFHFDRWWNPAVEDQATDRAYRIGQEKNVNVYKFIALGTIEERIDKMLEEKRNLADKILSSAGENWITDLSNEELREIFLLNKPGATE